MFFLFLISCGLGVLWGQTNGSPLFALPYSPSLDTSSMDRAVDPCTDFYHYACGAWIKKNPIPPDQARWDVYSKLNEDNERFLWGILVEASKPLASRNLVETEIGDYFAACMDQAAVEKAGAASLKPELDAIHALHSVRDIPAYLGRQHLGMAGSGMLFGFGSNQDFEDSSRVIAFADAGGIGLPDRDYYTKTDAKSVETRQKYVQHVQRMFELLGEAPAPAKAHAQTVMDIETELAKASLTRVEKRDPYKLFHKMTPAQLQALTPSFRWAAYFKTSAGAGYFGDQRQRTGVLQGNGGAAPIPQAGRLEDLPSLASGPLQGFVFCPPRLTTPISTSTASICAGWNRCRRAGSDACGAWTATSARRWARNLSPRPSRLPPSKAL